MKQTIIIGGGASGMACALTAARLGAWVTVLERERRPLRKLSASGNGRGNLLSRNGLRYAGDAAFAEKVLSLISPKQVEAFWHSVGVPLTEEEGRVYPSCFLAPQAAEALLLCAREAHVQIRCGVRVTGLRAEKGRFFIEAEESVYAEDQIRKNGKRKPGECLEVRSVRMEAEQVVLAFGGCAAPEFGTDGSAYALATGLGCPLTELRPALCALTTPMDFPPTLLGQRARVRLWLASRDGSLLASSQGEILFAEHAVSGIAAMQLARYTEEGCTLHINFTPTLCGEEAANAYVLIVWLAERKVRFPNRTPEELLKGCAPEALIRFLCRQGTDLVKSISDFTLPISGTRDFSSAQVTAGGLDTSAWKAETLESRLYPGLYALGEALNVDGDCGGYNLMFAVACGILAGKAVSLEK